VELLAYLSRFRSVVIGAAILASATLATGQLPASDGSAKNASDPVATEAPAKPDTTAATPATSVTVEPAGPAATSDANPATPPVAAPAQPANASATPALAAPGVTPPPPEPTPQPINAAPPVTTAANGYLACLGCPEHEALKNRWQRPWKYTVLAHAAIAASSIALEAHGRSLGLCERDPLMRSPQSFNGCHPFSWKRTLTLAVPIEALAFTSPSWGVSRWGHPRLGLAIEFIPIAMHLRAVIRTTHSINELNQQGK
jgi:hypothetical protein